jgi:hypothetical protein
LSERSRQELGASKSLPSGFTSAFEEQGRYWYDYQWQGDLSRFGFRSEYLDSSPSGEGLGGYSDWRNEARIGHMIMREVEAELSTSYTMRRNDTVSGLDDQDPTLTNDYETWTIRLGTSFPVARSTTFTTYVEHVERFSDNSQLAFSRDTFEAYFTFRHEF